MPKVSDYEQYWDGEWDDVENVKFLACCDCGLVHKVGHRLSKGKLQIRLAQDRRETARLRRHYKGEFKKA